MKRWTLAIAAAWVALTSGCKTLRREVRVPDPYADPTLASLLDEFRRDASKHSRPVSSGSVGKLRVMSFVRDVEAKRAEYGMRDFHEDTAGACTDARVTNKIGDGALEYRMSEAEWQEIWISDEFESKPNSWQLRELVYHELGHCLLGLDHKPGKEHGIMSAEIHRDSEWIARNWDRMLRELFESQK